MAWKLMEVPDDDPEATWTDAELIGVSILLVNECGPPQDASNVYFRAWEKMQAATEQAMDRHLAEDDE